MIILTYLIVSLSLSICSFIVLLLLRTLDLEDRRILGLSAKFILDFIELFAWTLLWYSISISFTLFNKWFLNIWEDGFHFPILATAIHMVIKTIISQFWACCTKMPITPMSWWLLFTLVIPIGISTGLDIMLSNLSLEYISVTNYTLLKSSVLLWTFLWAIIIGASPFEWRTFLSVVTISIGLALATIQSTQLELFGMSLVLAASGAAGLRWALLQALIIKDPVSRSLLGSIYRFSPASAVAIIPLALIIDLPPLVTSKFVTDPVLLWTATLWVLLGGVISFGLIAVEVKIVQLTSSVTLSVLGQVKELVQIVLAGIVFGDELSTVNIIGVAVSFAGMLAYKTSAHLHHTETEEQTNLYRIVCSDSNADLENEQ